MEVKIQRASSGGAPGNQFLPSSQKYCCKKFTAWGQQSNTLLLDFLSLNDFLSFLSSYSRFQSREEHFWKFTAAAVKNNFAEHDLCQC